MTGNTRPPPPKTDAEREAILEARERFHRLPDRQDAFTEGEFRRPLKMLGLADRVR